MARAREMSKRMKIIVNCPDSARIISIVVTGEKNSNIWVTQELQSIEQGNEITIPEPKEEQEDE